MLKSINKRFELIDRSTVCRRLYLGQDRYTGVFKWSDILHYFNENDEEIGMINTILKVVEIFDIPRKWDKSFIEVCSEVNLDIKI